MKIVGARGSIDIDNILHKARNDSISLQVLDANYVIGVRHIEVAYERTQRAFKNLQNKCKTVEMEFLRYVSCERQIKNAVKKVGAKPKGVYAFIFFDKTDFNHNDFIKNFGLEIDNSVLLPNLSKLKHYASDKELAIIDKSFYWDLIYEKITLLDITK